MSINTLLATLLIINLIFASIFLLKTKSQSSKMLVTLLFSTTGAGVVLLLFDMTNNTSLLDIALMVVLLSSVSAILFAKRLRYMDSRDV